MARPGLLYEEVAAAAEKLVNEGQKPSIQRIREELGNRGSTTTINRHLKNWRAEPKKIQVAKIDEVDEANTVTATSEASKVERVVAKTPKVEKTYVPQPPKRPEYQVSEPVVKYVPEPLEGLSPEKLKIKVLQLQTELQKEQSRRESAEHCARDMQDYADRIKDEVGQRMEAIQASFETTINDLRLQTAQLKTQAAEDLKFYQAALEKANSQLSARVGK